MLDLLLPYFPPHTYPLTLVSDPDGVLADEQIAAALQERSFRLIEEADPIALRYQVEHARPWSVERSLVVVTANPLNTLPYDLWQQGRHADLALYQLFPNLAYSGLQELSAHQRSRLAAAQADGDPPARPLSARETLEYLLQVVFDWIPGSSPQPARLLAWLDEYHARNDPMSPRLAQHLLAQWTRLPRFSSWPLAEILSSTRAFQQWVQQAWSTYLQVKEGTATYQAAPVLRFDADQGLQKLLPRLIGSGTLTPVNITPALELPTWTLPAVIRNIADLHAHHFATGIRELEHKLLQGKRGWQEWQGIAHDWARLALRRSGQDTRLPAEQLRRYTELQEKLDSLFFDWLRAHYAPLATLALPTPHHLHHVPGWLDYCRQEDTRFRPALLVLDGMSLADWMQIEAVWKVRHPHWRFKDALVLAQIPSITAISRQALISGRRPSQFAATLLDNRHEAEAWSAFWQARGLPHGSAVYERLPTTLGAPYPEAIDSRRTHALCLVSTVIDDMVHGATQGAADVQASLGVWLDQTDQLQQRAQWIEELIQQLLDNGYSVMLTSDHGHVEAIGMGQPQEGVAAVSRSKRARLYTSPDLARNVKEGYPTTILWHDDKLLPPDLWVLMPQGRIAFATRGEQVVSHGGLTLEEMVVPLVAITKD